MCYKCNLVVCDCVLNDQERSRNIDWMMRQEQDEKKEMGIRSIEDKNWAQCWIGGPTYFIHGSSVAPNLIKKSGGLSSAFGKERVLVNGVPGDKFFLAFPCQNNVVPGAVKKLSGAAGRLWSTDEFPFLYFFKVGPAYLAYRAPASNHDSDQMETGFTGNIPWQRVVRVFQWERKQFTYVRNSIADNNAPLETGVATAVPNDPKATPDK
jgi:hypothetical protein